jgi:hypothetical protein
MKGYYSKIILPKTDIMAELLRRVPNIQDDKKTKVNMKNTKIEGLMERLTRYPIRDKGDIQFIKSEFYLHETSLEPVVNAKADEDGLAGSKKTMSSSDRLRFIIILANNDTVRVAFLKSTDRKTREEIDGANSDKLPADWSELICELFNDSEYEAKTRPIPNLHSKFRDEIDCPKGEFDLNPETAKALMSGQKKKLRDMIQKYNASGNGSDMASHPEDVEGDGGKLESEGTYGRFNIELAKKRCRYNDQQDLLVFDGDDRKNFLKNNPYDLLYWWEEMDKNNLIYFFMGKLNDKIAASCDRTPAATSRKNKSSASDSDSNKRSKESVHQEMVANVAGLNKSMQVISESSIRMEKQAYERDLLNLELALVELDPAVDEARHKLLSARVDNLKKDIKERELQLEAFKTPRQLTYVANNNS